MTGELSAEDELRLNVLLAQQPLAIRIDEARQTLHALLADTECSVQLHPIGAPSRYLKAVREWLSGRVTGSPGGYPVHLHRWTRMGQMRDEHLEQLLLLGEPEAVVAVVCAPGLTVELARRAWWIEQNPDNARQMLRCDAVRYSGLGEELAGCVVEHLPFEGDNAKVMESMQLVAEPGLLGESVRRSLWQRARRRPVLYVGFLASCPLALPESAPPHPNAALAGELAAQWPGPLADLLVAMLSAPGQAYLKTWHRALVKAPELEVVQQLFALSAGQLRAARAEPAGRPDLAALHVDVEAWCTGAEVAAFGVPGRRFAPQWAALRFLSGLGPGLWRPLLGDSTASGALLRRKLAPVLDAIDTQVGLLTSG